MGKKSKKCSPKSRRISWFAFTILGLGTRGLATVALFVITLKMSPLQKEAQLFNTCVKEKITIEENISTAVNFCKGGGN